MENQFDPQEVLKISIKVEEAGAKLYGKLAEETDNPELKKII